jgi:hypothetical protein
MKIKNLKNLLVIFCLLVLIFRGYASENQFMDRDSCCFEIGAISLTPGDTALCCDDSVLVSAEFDSCYYYVWYVNGQIVLTSYNNIYVHPGIPSD